MNIEMFLIIIIDALAAIVGLLLNIADELGRIRKLKEAKKKNG